MKNKLPITIIPILLILLLIFSILTFANTKNENKSYIIDIEKYIYENLKLTPKEYEFKTISNNETGNIIYAFKIFKAKGTLLININIPNNLIGYRILENVKELSSICIGYDNSILLNTIAGENKFYYINPSKTLSLNSPSFNTTKIKSFRNGFYWLGFKYKDENKRLTDKNQYLFIFQNGKINSYSLDEIIKNKINYPFNLIVINSNKVIVEKAHNIINKDLYIFNLNTKELEQIENKKNIVLSNIFNNKFYYLITDNQNRELKIKSINIVNSNITNELSINIDENNTNQINYFPISFQKTENYILLNLFSKENKKLKTIVYNKNLEKILDENEKNNIPILYENQNKNGYYYLYKEYMEIFPLK